VKPWLFRAMAVLALPSLAGCVFVLGDVASPDLSSGANIGLAHEIGLGIAPGAIGEQPPRTPDTLTELQYAQAVRVAVRALAR
jgi:hypothetical protein